MIVPPARPQLTREAVRLWLEPYGAPRLALLGRRGYYRDMMGEPGKNDINIYDDAIALITPTRFITFNANTDPSRLYPGVAVLEPGLWLYMVGTHNITKARSSQYEALVQASQVTVRRHGKGSDTGWFGINIHRGSKVTTSSAGCQTIYPDQWDEFMMEVKQALAEERKKIIPYILLERPDAE